MQHSTQRVSMSCAHVVLTRSYTSIHSPALPQESMNNPSVPSGLYSGQEVRHRFIPFNSPQQPDIDLLLFTVHNTDLYPTICTTPLLE